MGYFQKRVNAFRFAFKGIAVFFKEGSHAKIHAAAAFTAISLGFSLNIKTNDWVAILFCIALVISLEAVNSAIESVVDLASPEIHPLAKKSKDIAAGAVLMASIFALIIGLLIFLPYLYDAY